MRLIEYLSDRIIFIITNIILMIITGLYLSICNLNNGQIGILIALWILILTVYLVFDWSRRRRYFKEIYGILEKVDKPYLISEIMPKSYRLDDNLHRDILKLSNKSVIDEVNHVEVEKDEYREFIESWIHEVKLPITAINLICDNNKSEITDKIKVQLSQIENDVEKALFYSRSDNVYKDYFIREINLENVVLKTIKKNKTYLTWNNVKIDLDIKEQSIYSDDKWLEFIITQILINSVKYKKDNIAIKFTTRKYHNKTKLLIEDNGEGIDSGELGRVFDKGFTGSNGRNTQNSTGLGLYLCKKLSRKLGMDIEIESEKGEFTRVIMSFPDGSGYFSR